jgi:hypothetical protein
MDETSTKIKAHELQIPVWMLIKRSTINETQFGN